MAARHYTIAIGAVARRLSDIYGDGVGVINAVHDVPYRQIILQAEAAKQVDVFVGEADVTVNDYGVLVPTAATNPPYVPLGPFDTGPLKLSDLYAISTGAIDLHILAVPF